MGILPTDTLLIHSSMKAIGEVEGGADTVLDAFSEYLSEGLLVLPAHTWANMSEIYNRYHPKTEPTCVGILPNLFLQREGVLRSLHPTHSLSALGKEAQNFVEGEENQMTPCGPGGCYDRLRQRNAKILLLGVGHERNTYIHCVEELLNIPDRLTKEPTHFEIVMPDNSIKNTYMYRHYNAINPHISEEYPKLEQAFYDRNAARTVTFGSARCILCDANKVYEVTKTILSHQPNCLMDLDKIPEEWWKHPLNG